MLKAGGVLLGFGQSLGCVTAVSGGKLVEAGLELVQVCRRGRVLECAVTMQKIRDGRNGTCHGGQVGVTPVPGRGGEIHTDQSLVPPAWHEG